MPARVVSPGSEPRIHGVDVQSDLTAHYSFAEVMLLALSGEPPDASAGRAFEVALVFLSATTVAEAPAHAAVLARLVGGEASAVAALGTVGLSEQARYEVGLHARWLSWLNTAPEAAPPQGFAATSRPEREQVQRLRLALPDAFAVSALMADPSPTAALIAVMHACGLRASWQLEAAWISARTPAVVAEGMAARKGGFRDYPGCLPDFGYEDGAGEVGDG